MKFLENFNIAYRGTDGHQPNIEGTPRHSCLGFYCSLRLGRISRNSSHLHGRCYNSNLHRFLCGLN